MERYRVFRRSARSFEEFVRTRKLTVRCGLSIEEARRICDEFNRKRTAAQERKGTKLEFERE